MANVGFQINGPSAGSFACSPNACGAATCASLAPGASCTVQVIFAPAASSASAAVLVISSSTLGVTPAIVPLNGNGAVTTGLGAGPPKLIFPVVLIGQSSTAQTVTVTNTGSFTATALALTVAAPFSLTQDTCTGHNLAASANCTVGVIFAPTASGKAIGTLAVVSASVIIPPTVPLSGTGTVPFDFTITVSGSSSQAVANGQTADFNLTIAPPSGSQGSFTLQCGTLPAYASCTFNPISPTAYSGASIYETVEIATGVPSSSARTSPPSAWPVLPLACGLVVVPFALKRRRRALLLIALLAILAGGVSSCTSSGGGLLSSNPQSGSGTTPAGTYSIPVSVSSNGVTHQITLTLTVD
jgi:hypothetical protein